VDEEVALGQIRGKVQWGQNIVGGVVDESMLDGYDVWLVDACGEQRLRIGQVLKRPAASGQMSSCCDADAYEFAFETLDLPQDSMSLMITPFQGSDSLPSGVMVPIRESSGSTTLTQTLTTKTTTTFTGSTTRSTTTVTSYIPISAVLRGCLGLTVSDPDTFLDDPQAKQAIKEVVAKASGADVLTEYVQDVVLKPGQSCSARRLSGRRLQTGIRADFVVVVPPTPATESLGGAEAIGRRAKTSLQLTSAQEATAWLEEQLQQTSLSTLKVAVTEVGSAQLYTAIDPLIIISGDSQRLVEEETEAVDTAVMIASAACVILVVIAVVLCTLQVIRYQRKVMRAREESRQSAMEPFEDIRFEKEDDVADQVTARPIERIASIPNTGEPAENERDVEAFPLDIFHNEDTNPSYATRTSKCFAVDCSKSTTLCCGGEA